MNIKNLKKAMEILQEESINNCVKMVGTKEFNLLVVSKERLKGLIWRLENPGKAKKVDKMCDG